MAIDPDELRKQGIEITPELLKQLKEQTAKSHGLTISEHELIKKISWDGNFYEEMAELKQNNPIEFQIKLAELKNTIQNTNNIPKCPTCGSTDIRKISGTKRFVSTGIFGLASSNIGKNMECRSCGAKWQQLV